MEGGNRMVTNLKEGDSMSVKKDIRRAKISKQRQITIPKDFYDALHMKDEMTIEFTGNAIIMRPTQPENVDFSVDILKDLTAQGYTGAELITKFAEIKRSIPDALKRLEEEAMKGPTLIGEDLGAFIDSLDDDEDDE